MAATTVELLHASLIAFITAHVKKETRRRLPKPLRIPRPYDKQRKPSAAEKLRGLAATLRGTRG